MQGDGERRDPFGDVNLVEADFAWATERLMEIAERHAKGRIVSVLEGGYRNYDDLAGFGDAPLRHSSFFVKKFYVQFSLESPKPQHLENPTTGA